MFNIGLVPLDDRPCNTMLIEDIADIANAKIIMPPRSMLGYFTKPANIKKITAWLYNNANKFDGLIVSIDMLSYGGLINSRLPNISLDSAKNNLAILKKIKNKYPKLPIYTSNIIMRLTSTVTNDKQLEYWKNLFKYSTLLDSINNNIPKSKKELLELKEKLPKPLLMDYMKARFRNHEINKYSLMLLKEGIIDYLLIGQEDAAVKGLHKNEQRILNEIIIKDNLADKTKILCGADELNLLLLSKLSCNLYNIYPKFSATFSTIKGPNIISLYEDRTVIENLQAQISSIGECFSSSFEKSDIILLINSPVSKQQDLMFEKKLICQKDYFSILSILKKYHKHCIIGLADISFCNGGDLKLFKKIQKSKLYTKINSYAGWNTSANTLGTVISNTISCFIAKKLNINTINKQNMLIYKRFLDDICYQALTRPKINSFLKKKNVSVWNLGKEYNKTNKLLNTLFKKTIPSFIAKNTRNINISLPWPRTFEADLDIKLINND